jgi:hypothetical protein
VSKSEPLRVGDLFELRPGHRVYLPNGGGLLVADSQTAGTYAVERTTVDGGGTGHGPHDVFPDGHHVFATRPYGPDGADLCAGCMFGEDGAAPDPDVQAEASRQFAVRIDAVVASGHAPMIGEGFADGPLPAPAIDAPSTGRN